MRPTNAIRTPGFVYMMSNDRRTVLYIGVTSDLRQRYVQHRDHLFPGSFTDRYRCEALVYFEQYDDIGVAIERETTLKKWSRKKKDLLIWEMNPSVENLGERLLEEEW